LIAAGLVERRQAGDVRAERRGADRLLAPHGAEGAGATAVEHLHRPAVEVAGVVVDLAWLDVEDGAVAAGEGGRQQALLEGADRAAEAVDRGIAVAVVTELGLELGAHRGRARRHLGRGQPVVHHRVPPCLLDPAARAVEPRPVLAARGGDGGLLLF